LPFEKRIYIDIRVSFLKGSAKMHVQGDQIAQKTERCVLRTCVPKSHNLGEIGFWCDRIHFGDHLEIRSLVIYEKIDVIGRLSRAFGKKHNHGIVSFGF
jgi:hypothetical protein